MRIRASRLDSADTLWQLHDFLSGERHAIEAWSELRFEELLFVFAELVQDSLLQLDELTGLDREKLAKIAAMAPFTRSR